MFESRISTGAPENVPCRNVRNTNSVNELTDVLNVRSQSACHPPPLQSSFHSSEVQPSSALSVLVEDS